MIMAGKAVNAAKRQPVGPPVSLDEEEYMPGGEPTAKRRRALKTSAEQQGALSKPYVPPQCTKLQHGKLL